MWCDLVHDGGNNGPVSTVGARHAVPLQTVETLRPGCTKSNHMTLAHSCRGRVALPAVCRAPGPGNPAPTVRCTNLVWCDLAQKASVDVMTISRLERGTKKRLEVEPLARQSCALGVSADYLVGLRGTMEDTGITQPPKAKA